MARTDLWIDSDILTIPAGGRKTVHNYARMLSILGNTADERIHVGLGERTPVPLKAGIQYELPADEHFESVTFYNQAASETEVEYILSQGLIHDNRLTISGSVFADIETNTAPASAISTPASMSVSTKDSIAANTSRKELIIQNNGTAAIRYGDTNVTASRGLRLSAGKQVVLTTTAEVFLIAETGTQTVDYMELS